MTEHKRLVIIQVILGTIILLIAIRLFMPGKSPEVSIVTDESPGVAVEHGLSKLQGALAEKKIPFERVQTADEASGSVIILSGLSTGSGEAAGMLKTLNIQVPAGPESIVVKKTDLQSRPGYIVSGSDDNGLMYGLLEISDRIGWSKDKDDPFSEVRETIEKPDIRERAISFYTMNRAYWESRFYDEEYWKRYLDILAQNRFNSMVVIFGYENGGFLAPCYPYFFDTEGFPDVKMIGITPQEQERNLKALTDLIKMAHDRGIRFTVGIWDHIYRGGVQGGGIPGAQDVPDQPVPGLVWGVNEENLISYNKTALAKFVKMVPGLDAIQFRMHNESGLKRDEQVSFWNDVFKMIKETSPDLQCDLRAKELPDEVVQSAIDIGIKFRITTKYWMEQMGQPFHPTQINPERSPRRHSYGDMLRYPQQYKVHWRLWNGGTARILLWGDPEYVRRFAESAHLYDGDSYEINEPLATKMEAQPHDATPFNLLNPEYVYYDYEFERYWHLFQVFGRIGYSPSTPEETWHREFEKRFGKDAGPYIESALHRASRILPRIIASCYPYSGFPMTRGWAEKQRLGNLEAYARNSGSDIQQFANFDEEARLLIENGETAKILPSVNSVWFEKTSEEINRFISDAEKEIGRDKNKEFVSTVTDLKILSYLALYHSRRIPAAVSYRLFERTKDPSALDAAIGFERSAVEAWRMLVSAAGDVYAGDLMMGVRVADLCGHWKDELAALEEGLASLEKRREGLDGNTDFKKAPSYKKSQDSDLHYRFTVSHEPVTSLPEGSPLKVTVKVTAAPGIKWVSLSYRSVNQDTDYKTMPMLPSSEPGIYEATVPADQINPTWDFMYFIKIVDNDKNGIIYPDLNSETPYIIVNLVR